MSEANWYLHPTEDFERLSEHWQALNSRSWNTPLLDPLFIRPLLSEFSSGKELIAVCGAVSDPLAMAVLSPSGHGAWQTFQPAQAPLGIWLHRNKTVCDETLFRLVRFLPGFAWLIGISQQDPDFTSRPTEQGRFRTLDYIRTARITVPEDFSTYWASRGKNLRHTMKRQRNRLSRKGIEPRLEALTRPQDMTRAVADYGVLESSGWKGRTDNAVHADNRQGRFYTAMLEALASVNEAIVYRYWYNDKLVASDLCVHRNENMIILKTTYDETQKDTSPSHLMRETIFKYLFDKQQFQTIEFFGRVMDWHTKWSDEIRTMFHLNYYRYPLLRTLHPIISR